MSLPKRLQTDSKLSYIFSVLRHSRQGLTLAAWSLARRQSSRSKRCPRYPARLHDHGVKSDGTPDMQVTPTHLAELGEAAVEETRAVVADYVADLAAVVVAFLGHVVHLLHVEEIG